MRVNTLRLLVLCDAVLLLILLAFWLSPEGSLRHTRWTPPAAKLPDLPAMSPGPGAAAIAGDRLVSLLDKPLFSESRRPPPPVAAPSVAVPEVADPLAHIQLLGVFKAGDSGGIIASVDGKPQRILLNHSIGPWTVRAIDGREVRFARGQEVRVLKLLRKVEPAAGANASGGHAAATPVGPVAPAPAVRLPPSAAAAAAPVPLTPAQRAARDAPGFGLIRGIP